MKSIVKFELPAIEALAADARKEVGSAQIAPAYLQGLRANIASNPSMYRSFGPYWWLIKREMLAMGIKDFGESVDTETADALDYGDRDLNCAAGYAYQLLAFDTMAVYGHHHAVQLEDGTIAQYVLADEEVEAIEVGRLVQAGIAQVQ